jgi:hypothetical protein
MLITRMAQQSSTLMMQLDQGGPELVSAFWAGVDPQGRKDAALSAVRGRFREDAADW